MGKKWPKFARFQKNLNSKLPVFYESFQKVARNIEGFCSFSYFHMCYLAKFD